MSKTILDDLSILIEKGIYSDRDELISDAFRALLRSKPHLREELAVELYKRRKVSLSRASEICGVNIEDFKELLKEEGIELTVPELGREISKEVEEILKICR
ncbi:UPF0175 family protein [candidate division WOR-3 bacterium]|nr:UPF0175 family protein [candidate division WOR-3 bacterium]